jgi:putative peptidoglycan lipid II flippase
MPAADVASDLRGLGNAMCLLLDADDKQVAAHDHKMPFLISTTIAGLRNGDGGIASAATALALLREATGNDEAAGNDAEGARVMPPLPPPPPGRYAGFRDFEADDRSAAARRQVIRLGLVTAAVIAVVALVALGSTLNRVLGNDHGAAVFSADKLGLSTPASSVTKPPPQVLHKAAAPAEPVQPVGASVFSPDGSPDSPQSAGAAIDGDPATAWSTDTYFDADPFPKFKPGVGLLVQLGRPAALSAVTVDLTATGTMIQLRTATTNTPATLADTTELTPPTPMAPGRNRIPVANAAPVSNVLVWICALGSSDGQNRASISEIGLQAAPPPA